MKKIIGTMLLAAFAIVSVNAQEIPERKSEGARPQAKERSHGKKQMADLNLSEEQKTKFKALNDEHRQQLTALRAQDNITVKESKEKMEALRKDHQAKMQSILTPEQQDKMAKAKEAQQARMKEAGKYRGEKGMKKGQRGDRAEKMKAELNLTEDQSAKLEANRKATMEKMKAVREDKSLTDEQKKEKSKELMKAQKESLKSVLTEEQLQKMKSSRTK